MRPDRKSIGELSARLEADLLALNGRIAPVRREFEPRVLLALGAGVVLLGVVLLAGRKRSVLQLGTLAMLRLLPALTAPARR